MIPGTILSDPAFQFSDGSTGNKIFIILNETSDTSTFITAKTTTNPAHRTRNYGCQLQDRYPNFYLPKGRCCLRKETWVDLNEFFEFTFPEFMKKHFENKKIEQIGKLSGGILKDLLLCAMQSDDISLSQKAALNLTLASIDN